MKQIKALSLFSGGLDSILATRLIMEQGIEVLAVQFVTPFFNYAILEDIETHRQKMLEKYGIHVLVVDISIDYLQLLHNPAHGFGKNFNPCIDCKIMMFKKAKEMLVEHGASFLISGEVLGQRPMSQRRDTMNVVERDSGTRAILLRPLCAQLMLETAVEKQGLVDRSRLLKMTGRSRSPQLALAAQYGITDFPAPAGGCILADPILSRRIKKMYTTDAGVSPCGVSVTDIRSLLIGRQFVLPGGGWLILGRDEKENDRLADLVREEDAVLLMEDWPGPTAVLKKIDNYAASEMDLKRDLLYAAGIVVRYGRKQPEGKTRGDVTCTLAGEKRLISIAALQDSVLSGWNMH
jgi:tRNA-specific 2-thiouridylase